MAVSFEEYESRLAQWAAKSSTTRGRAYSEEEHPYRSPYQRDRDRIVHSTAFRRLESKTQVYTHLYLEGDNFRKRLTHTLEVAQIARSIARELRLNEDLTEAAALAHDLGHAPFGHTGQDILHNLMGGAGGFEHNTQSLRIISLIEHRYPEFPGLNLTYEVREAVAKKGKRQLEPLADEFKNSHNPTLEGQVVDIADPITYSTHDLDDGISAGTITADMLKECEFWQEGEELVRNKYPDIKPKILRYQVLRYIINEQATDLINTTRENVNRLAPKNVDDIRNADTKLAGFSKKMQTRHNSLKSFLRKNMYQNSRVKKMEHKAGKVITGLFDLFLEQPGLLPENVQPHFEAERKKGNEKRIVCDYIAGMTDRFALDEYNKLFDVTGKV